MNRTLRLTGILLCGVLFTGCTYIQTLDPNDGRRLEQLKLARLERSEQSSETLTPDQVMRRIEGLRSSRQVFRTRLDGETVIVESFSDLGQLQSTIENSLKGFAGAVNAVQVVHGTRTGEDQLPAELFPQDPEGCSIQVSGLFGDRPGMSFTHVVRQERKGPPERLFQDLRMLTLLREPKDTKVRQALFDVNLTSAEGVPLGSLILDEDNLIHYENPRQERFSYALLNDSQATQLKGLMQVLLYEFRPEQEIPDPVEQPQAPRLELPYDEPGMIIGHSTRWLEYQEGDLSHQLVFEQALTAPTEDQGEFRMAGKPEWQSVITHFVLTKKSSDPDWSKPIKNTWERIDQAGAEQLAQTWGYAQAEVDQTRAMVRAEAANSFMSSALSMDIQLKPDFDWRKP